LRAFNITLNKKQGYTDIRDKMELILDDGFAKARPFYFSTPVGSVVTHPLDGEFYYANLDSNKVGWDFFFDDKTNTYTAQATIGIGEAT
jgi:hypothetical protein